MNIPRIYADFNGYERHDNGLRAVALDTAEAVRALVNDFSASESQVAS